MISLPPSSLLLLTRLQAGDLPKASKCQGTDLSACLALCEEELELEKRRLFKESVKVSTLHSAKKESAVGSVCV